MEFSLLPTKAACPGFLGLTLRADHGRMQCMANLREVAALAGVSLATASYALKNSPRISDVTKKKVAACARQLDYAPVPMVAALMEHVRRGRPIAFQGLLAVLVPEIERERWLTHPVYRGQYHGFRDRAAELGYLAECLHFSASRSSQRSLERVLSTRGFEGILLAANFFSTPCRLNLPWERFATVRSDYMWESPAVDRVVPDYRQHVELCFQKLRGRGLRRIGMLLHENSRYRAGSNWLAGYLVCTESERGSAKIPLLVVESGGDFLRTFRRWNRLHKPDAVLGHHSLVSAIRSDREFDGLHVAALVSRTGDNFPGIDLHAEEIGRRLCDHLSQLVSHNRRGIPSNPATLLIPGSWVGESGG